MIYNIAKISRKFFASCKPVYFICATGIFYNCNTDANGLAKHGSASSKVKSALEKGKKSENAENILRENIAKEFDLQLTIGSNNTRTACYKNKKQSMTEPTYGLIFGNPMAESQIINQNNNQMIINNESMLNNKPDFRKIIPNTDNWPYSVHGLVSMDFDGTECWGSGTLIAPSVVLTAAHNLYDTNTQQHAKNIKFSPARNGDKNPFREIEVAHFIFTEDYEKGNSSEDYGVLFLKNAVGYQTGYFGIGLLDPKDFKNTNINVTGYPGDLNKEKGKHTMWGEEGKGEVFKNDSIRYNINTYRGQSGSGVWFKENDDYFVTGIHVHGGDGSYNEAVWITEARYKQIIKWTEKHIDNISIVKTEKIKVTECDLSSDILGFIFGSGNLCEALAKEKIPLLEVLNLSAGIVRNEGIESLIKINLPRLRKLYLDNNAISSYGAQLLSQANWPDLEAINLSENNVRSQGAKFISQANWSKLQVIDLSWNNIGSEGANYISQTNWPDLKSIDLNWNDLRPVGAKFISQANWPKLQSIYLMCNIIGSEGMQYIIQTNWPNLKTIYLGWTNYIGSEEAKFISQANWPNLEEISFNDNEIGSEGARHISQANWLNLKILRLYGCKIGSEGATHLSQANWPVLKIIDLRNNNIKLEGAAFISQANWNKLEEISVGDNNISYFKSRNIFNQAAWAKHAKVEF